MHKHLLLLLSLAITLFCHAEEITKTDAIFERTNPKYIGRLYQMLKVFDDVAKEQNISYWMDGGTLLGAVRHAGIIPWDDDADLMMFEKDRAKLLAQAHQFEKYGFYLMDCDTVIRVFPTHTQHYPFIDILTAEYDPESKRIVLAHPECRQHYTKEFYFPYEIENISPMKFGPLLLNAPANPMRYLKHYYGAECMTKAIWWNQVHWRESEKVNLVDFSPADYILENPEPALPTPKRVYVDVCADIMHAGHVEFFKNAKAFGDYLIVGVLSDQDVASYKRMPILTLEERVAEVKGCRYVDEVIAGPPMFLTEEWIRDNHIDIVVHGDDFNPDTMHYWYGVPMRLGIFRTVPYTKGISTTDIIKRIQNRLK